MTKHQNMYSKIKINSNIQRNTKKKKPTHVYIFLSTGLIFYVFVKHIIIQMYVCDAVCNQIDIDHNLYFYF